MVVHRLRLGAHFAFETRAWESDPNRSIQLTVYDTSDGVRSKVPVPNMSPKAGPCQPGKFGSWLSVTSVSSIRVIFLSIKFRRRCTSRESSPTARPTGRTCPAMHLPRNQELPPLVRDLTIDYTALSLAMPEKFAFASSWRARTGTGGRSSTIARYNTRTSGRATTRSALRRATTAGCGTRRARPWIFLSRRRTTRRLGSACFAWLRFSDALGAL